MSQDIQLTQRCPHYTIEERVILGADRRSLATRQPVSADSSVSILANNDFTIPRFGLYNQAQLFSASSGPYRIITNETDLTVYSQTEQVSLSLPIGSRVETDYIVQEFNTLSTDIFAENSNGHLVFSDVASLGSASQITVTGNAVSALGFSTQTRVRGRQVFPGWELAPRPDTINNRFPRFVSPVRQNPVFKVTYSVPQRRCLRCGGTRVENDYRFDAQGDVIVLENENLLHQIALKILLTTKGSNPFHQWYGTTLKSRIGAKAIGTVASLINEDVRRALEDVQRLQTAQKKVQSVTFKERLHTIQSVRTFALDADPTAFLIEVFVSNASREPVNLSVLFTVPNVTLLGGPGGFS